MQFLSTVTQLLGDLVAINSINPDLVAGGAGEGDIGHFIAQWLTEHGLHVETQTVQPGRSNVVGIATGAGGGRTLMLNGHMDTVGTTGMTHPFIPRIEDQRMYGRGAYDMKCGLAAAMIAAVEAKKASFTGDVVLTAVVDEEFAGLGTMEIVKRYKADAAIVVEPTEMQAVIAHKGFVWLDIETQGLAAHGSRPDLGIDAIAKMGRVLSGLQQLNQTLCEQPSHPLLKSGSLHCSLITGGQELSSYPARCVVSVERRTIPGETPEIVEAQIEEILQPLRAEDSDFRATVRRGLDRTPMNTRADLPIVQLLGQHSNAITGQVLQTVGVPYWTDAATLAAAGIPAILFGPTGTGAHAVEEWVDLRTVAQCAEIYLAIARDFCG